MKAAAHASKACLVQCLRFVDHAIATAYLSSLALSTLRVKVATAVPEPLFTPYLEEISVIIAKSSPDDRSILIQTVVKMIMEDLPDATKRIGVEWWLRLKGAFRGIEASSTPQARL